MKHDQDWKILTHYWNRLSRPQRRALARAARLCLLEQRLYIFIISLFVFIARLLVPIPRVIRPVPSAHWL